MPAYRRLIPLISLILLLAFITACALPAPIARLFATETPTPTPTPTSTPTPTATPLPPISIAPCSFESDCPNALLINTFLKQDPEPGVINYVSIPYNEHVRFAAGWYALGDETLNDNRTKMEWVFEIDGHDYYQPDMVKPGFMPDDKAPSVQYPGLWIGVDLADWQVNQPHHISIGFTFNEALTDGWYDYPAGFSAVYEYNVKPALLPSATPTPLPTETPLPTKTSTPRPTAIPYTSTPSCDQNATITINNTTGGTVTLYLNGPTKYTFSVGTGYTYLKVCSGSYSYTAYGCGGASDNGTINSGEEHEFYCY